MRVALLLAGGASSRMGVDKPTLLLNGEMLIQRSLQAALSVECDLVAVVGHRGAISAAEELLKRFKSCEPGQEHAYKHVELIGIDDSGIDLGLESDIDSGLESLCKTDVSCLERPIANSPLAQDSKQVSSAKRLGPLHAIGVGYKHLERLEVKADDFVVLASDYSIVSDAVVAQLCLMSKIASKKNTTASIPMKPWVVLAHDGHWPQTLCGIYSAAAMEVLYGHALAGERKIRAAFQQFSTRFVFASSIDLQDVDTPEDLAKLNKAHIT